MAVLVFLKYLFTYWTLALGKNLTNQKHIANFFSGLCSINVISISKCWRSSLVEKVGHCFQFSKPQRCEGGNVKDIPKQGVSFGDKGARKTAKSSTIQAKIKSTLQCYSGSCQMSRNAFISYLYWWFLYASNHVSSDWTTAEKPTFSLSLEQYYVVSKPQL